MALPPEFPAPFVIERARSLGFGTGPWKREQLVERWGAPTADKFVSDAKAAGWLVSPYRGTYFIPAAQDLTVVPWLPDPVRGEFLISRTLASADIPYWSLSAWCRGHGLELGAPVFVTDLGVGRAVRQNRESTGLDRKTLRDAARQSVGNQRSVPFLDALLIVPLMPALKERPHPKIALVPEGPSVEAWRKSEQMVGQAVAGLIALTAWAIQKEPPDVDSALQEFKEIETKARGIPYSLGPEVDDTAWIVALLASLGTGRTEELVGRLNERRALPDGSGVQQWAGLMGPPQPVTGWREAILEGPYPYLLVPDHLWTQMGADQAARRFRTLNRLGGA